MEWFVSKGQEILCVSGDPTDPILYVTDPNYFFKHKGKQSY